MLCDVDADSQQEGGGSLLLTPLLASASHFLCLKTLRPESFSLKAKLISTVLSSWKLSKLMGYSSFFFPSLCFSPCLFYSPDQKHWILLRTLFSQILNRFSLQMSAQPPALGYAEVLNTHTHTSIPAAFSFTETIIILSVQENDSNMSQLSKDNINGKFTSNPTYLIIRDLERWTLLVSDQPIHC